MKQLILAGVLMAVVAGPAQGQLPEGSALLKKYAGVVGAAAMLEYKTFHTGGRFEMPGVGLSGTIEVSRARPDRVFMRVALPGVGEITRGFDGDVAWSNNPMEGVRIMTGSEAAQMKEESALAATIRDAGQFSAIETVEKTNLAGQDCYRVKLTWKSGRTSHDCYAVDSGLLIATWNAQPTPTGDVEVVTLISDYKKFGAVLLPTKIVQTFMGQEHVITIDSTEFDTLNDAVFDLPAAVKAKIQE